MLLNGSPRVIEKQSANQTSLLEAIENKYSLLLTTLVFIIVVSPLIGGRPVLSFCFQTILFMLIIVIMLKILKAGRLLFSIVIAMALAAATSEYLFFIEGKTNPYTALSAFLIYLAFAGVAIAFLLQRIFTEQRVSGDTIKGSISVYLLLGIWWYLLYGSIWLLDPGAFGSLAPELRLGDFFYFSFATMTTVGYGDIVPKSQFARTAAILQAIAGQMYIAILVARLVGLHSTGVHWRKEKP